MSLGGPEEVRPEPSPSTLSLIVALIMLAILIIVMRCSIFTSITKPCAPEESAESRAVMTMEQYCYSHCFPPSPIAGGKTGSFYVYADDLDELGFVCQEIDKNGNPVQKRIRVEISDFPNGWRSFKCDCGQYYRSDPEANPRPDYIPHSLCPSPK